ncbi:trifunctional hydroxymethylpyrimidine kinase/phosphomethylpyrimidine kinase/thiaminase [Lithohypha guttulata]|uniref:trifunctional hydroxymethylpyrimidine kinase/phosphomethylpyrimidine kinase/thiaminase n=1 Tax=Lithohypha guttulata TaxID=1690604 RepID=UPI002DE0A8E5|nr:trifunctional hydroxymethylpyrimidine kinase/phosphomethylpyrimidine kinase/thiaminase [Lithohypha guttulata]
MSTTIPRVLVIAGSDSSGGAGVEADQKALYAHGVYAQTVITALTAQNTLGVSDVHITPPSFLAKQIDACLSDIGCDVVKIGMLASAATVEVVADKLLEWKNKNEKGAKADRIVLDPVMISTSGAQLLPGDAVRGLLHHLVKDVELVTPNVPEAVLMLKEGNQEDIRSPTDLDGLKQLAKDVYANLGPRAVLLKGGHVPFKRQDGKLVKAGNEEEREIVVDVLFDGTDLVLNESAYARSHNTHGTGCSLASAVAANLALGYELKKAVRRSIQYVGMGIKKSLDFSKGPGPINHFHNVQILPFVEGGFIEYLLDREDVRSVWQKYTCHPFATQMGDGSLPIGAFKEYLIQDYLYLTHFARTNALAAYKSTGMDAITAAAQIVLHIDREMALHLDYCKEFGLSKGDILAHKESLACTAYSRYVLDIGQSQDGLALQMSLAPCLLGYGIAAKRLHTEYRDKHDGNRYWKWIENYVADDYQEAVRVGSDLIERSVIKQSPSRIEELISIFIRAAELEVRFWDFGAHASVG